MAEDKNRAKKRLYIHNNVIETSLSTKKKPGYIKIIVPDELVTGLSKSLLGIWCSDNHPKIMALELHWVENTTDDKKEG